MNSSLKVKRRFERKVGTVLVDAGMAGERLLVAISGGPDSLALLYSLHELQADLELDIVGAHLNHGLRGEESDADASFVTSVFETMGLRHYVEKKNVQLLRAKCKLSLEEAAREARYEFLTRAQADCGAAAVVLGHTADDQAETVLMNILRGSGLTGLRGMRPSSAMRWSETELRLLRPLLDLSRVDTSAYCEALGLEPRLDRSNLSTDLRRNRVRLELLPMLETYNPAVKDALIRLSSAASRDLSYIEEEVEEIFGVIAVEEGDSLALDRWALEEEHEAVRNYLVRRAVSWVKGDLVDVELYHVEEMVRLIEVGTGKSLDLPGGLRFAVDYDRVTIGPADLTEPSSVLSEFELEVPGTTTHGGWMVTAKIVEPEKVENLKDSDKLTGRFDLSRLGSPISVRSRVPGDRFQPLGMHGSKRIQDFMVDAKVPRRGRDSTPLLVSPRGIAWVVGWQIAHRARVRKQTRAVLELRFQRG